MKMGISGLNVQQHSVCLLIQNKQKKLSADLGFGSCQMQLQIILTCASNNDYEKYDDVLRKMFY